MGSKQLHSILSKVPSATADGEKTHSEPVKDNSLNASFSIQTKLLEQTDRIVAVIPKMLKEEIKDYLKTHKGETEKIVILKALKLMGFTVQKEWLIDKRSTR